MNENPVVGVDETVLVASVEVAVTGWVLNINPLVLGAVL